VTLKIQDFTGLVSMGSLTGNKPRQENLSFLSFQTVGERKAKIPKSKILKSAQNAKT
jgi:hypothetical protein